MGSKISKPSKSINAGEGNFSMSCRIGQEGSPSPYCDSSHLCPPHPPIQHPFLPLSLHTLQTILCLPSQLASARVNILSHRFLQNSSFGRNSGVILIVPKHAHIQCILLDILTLQSHNVNVFLGGGGAEIFC